MFTAFEDVEERMLSLDEFADAWAAHERDRARLALAAAHLDATGEYGADGAVTLAAWLRQHCRMSDTDAAALVRLGRFLRNHDTVADAALDSTLSAGHVHALRTNVNRTTAELFTEHAAELVSIIAPLDVRDAEQACKAWRQHAEAVTDQPEPATPERQLVCSRAGDGSLIGRFSFDEALSAEFETALATAITWEGAQDTRSVGVRQADAMFDVFAFFNANHDRTGTPRRRPHVEITINGEHLTGDDCCAATVDGDPIPASATDAFLCDSTLQRFMTSGSVPLDVGRATRSVPVDIFRAVAQRDGGCRHPGCNRKIAWCDAHHLTFWRHGGGTSLDNLVLLCARHHHLIHRPGWHLKLLPDATVELTTPEGRTLTSEPHPRSPLKLVRLQT